MVAFALQSTLRKILKPEVTHSRLSLLRALVMKSKKPTWNESSADSVPLKEYAHVCSYLVIIQSLTSLQISLVKDTVSDKKKKAHQGYAFIVYEREKDMKGITSMPIYLALLHFPR